jgi:WD40 repeat protein
MVQLAPSLDVLRSVSRAVAHETYELQHKPESLWQGLYNRLRWEPEAQILLAREASRRRQSNHERPWLKLRHRPDDPPGYVREFRGHTREISSCALDLHRGRIYSTSFDGTVREWDLWTGAVLQSASMPDGDEPFRVLHCRGRDIVITCAGDGYVRRAPAEALHDSSKLTYFHGGRQIVADLSPDGRYVAVGGELYWPGKLPEAKVSSVQVFDLNTDRRIVQKELDGRLSAIAFSPDGRHVAASGTDGCLLIQLPNADADLEWLDRDARDILSCTFDPTGERLATAAREGSVVLWHVETRTRAADLQPGHGAAATSVAFSPDGSRVVAGSADGVVRLWDVHDGRESVRIEAHADEVKLVAFTPDGDAVVSAGLDGSICVIEASSGRLLDRLLGHGGSIITFDIGVSQHGTYLLSASNDMTMRLWNLNRLRDGEGLPDSEGINVFRDVMGHTSDSLAYARFSEDGSSVVTTSWLIKVWDARTGRVRSIPATPMHSSDFVVDSGTGVARRPTGPVRGPVVFWQMSPVSTTIAGVNVSDGTVGMWNIADSVWSIRVDGRLKNAWSLTYFPNGDDVAWVDVDGMLRMCSINETSVKDLHTFWSLESRR